MVLSNVHSWMSIASTISKNKKEALDANFLNNLNAHLDNFAFLAGTPQASLADWTVYFAMGKISDLEATLQSCGRAVQRWYDATQCSVHGSAEGVNSHFDVALLPAFVEIPKKVQNLPTFYYPSVVIISDGESKEKQMDANSSSTKQDSVDNKEGKKGGPSSSTLHVLTDEQKKAAADKRAKKAAEKAAKKKKKTPEPAPEQQINISALDIRVGKIIRAWEHPEATKLYCEEVDVGEDKPRQIASGLRPFYKLEEMQHQRVLVLCNLKARSLVGFSSHGMVLCASNADHSSVEFAVPPEGAAIGERVVFEGFENGEPEAENKVNKKKMFEKLALDLKTDREGVMLWKGAVSRTSAGPCRAVNGMKDAQVA